MPDRPFDNPHRLSGFNYSGAGSYMITFNTANRNPILSKIVSPDGDPWNAYPQLTDIGRIVERYILQIPAHYPNVYVDAFVIMPDHVHILLTFSSEETEYAVQYSRLSRIEHALKTLVTKELGFSVWQLDFYDCIAFSNRQYDAFADYIADNPSVWFARNGEEAPLPQRKAKTK